MKRSYRLLALLFALILTISTFSGCKLAGPDETQPVTIETIPGATAAPEETAAPTPAFEVNEASTEALDALDEDVFRWYATSDGYTYHMLVDNPASYQIDPASVTMNLGNFTEEDNQRFASEANEYLTRLEQINREELPAERQFSYDVLHQLLTDYARYEEQYAYYYEPLTEYRGIHANLPLSFALFELKDTQDIEDYLTLLSDTPRYLGQVLAYEQKRAELGIFMTKDALDAVLEDCKTLIDSRDTLFLYTTFNDAIDQLTSLTPDQAQSYKDRNAELLKSSFISAYESLYDGLKDLRSHCRTYEEAAAYNETQKGYYEYAMQGEGGNSLSVEETLEMLKTEYFYLYNDIVNIQIKTPDIRENVIKLTSGNTQKDIDYLKSVISGFLPELPEHNLTLTDVPEELESMFSPAAYVIPAMDDWKENTIFINTSIEDDTPLLTLAHEGYPGHLYQYIYQRDHENIGLMQRAANFGGYAEGWAQFAEFLITDHQTQYDQDYVRIQFEYSMLFNSIIPAMLSILVNYYGYSETAAENYLTGIGLDGEALASYYYNLVVDQPYYFLEYAVGYCEIAQLYRDEQDTLGDRFDLGTFLKTYLNLGPAYYEQLREQMDVWADSLVSEAA